MMQYALAVASMIAAPVPRVPAPMAAVHAHSVVQPGGQLVVHVPANATYVGSDRFDLYGVADAQVHVFVQADAKKQVKTLYWVQFESYWPSMPDMTHDYSTDRAMNIGGITTWVRSGPAAVSAPSRAGSDREHVQAILQRAGYTVPPEVMNVRMVQLLDDPKGTGRGRDELMLIYSEDLASTGKTLSELRTDGKPNANWPAIEAPLIDRAKTRFRVDRK